MSLSTECTPALLSFRYPSLFIMICWFSAFKCFPRVMKVSVRSLNILCKLTNQRFCPDSVQVLYISTKFLAGSCRCEKSNWFVVLTCRRSSSFVGLKCHKYVANAVTGGLAPFVQFSEFDFSCNRII